MVVEWTYGIPPDEEHTKAYQRRFGSWVVDVFVRKYDPTGRELWTRQFGSEEPEKDAAYSVAVDAQGNVFVVGYTSGILPGQNIVGRSDAFVRKYCP